MIEIEPFTTAQARKSTLVVAGVLTAIAGWQLYRGRAGAATILGGLAAALLICAAVPPAARAFHRAWMSLAMILGWVNSRIILGVLFFLVMTPISFAVRLSGHDPLTRRGPKKASYWHPRAEQRQTRQGFERAF